MNGVGSSSHLQAALGGQYLVERELGGGGMSRTYVARDVTLDRRVVVKVLPPDLAATVSHDRFRREILVSASLQHPNIVGILTAGEADTLPYFTMPFVDGESLRMRIQRHGALSVGQSVSVLRDVARALAYAHERGIVHRDIKPDNVLLTAGAAVVADFGVAKALSSARVRRHNEHDATITTAGTALGTPAYMAPEQAAGDPNADHRADLYAFGVMAYEMLTGESPFAGRPPAQMLAAHITEQPKHIAAIRSDIPRALTDLVMRCLEKDPTRRPQSAGEVAVALEDPAMVSGAFASAPVIPVARPAGIPMMAKVTIGLLAAALLAAVGVISLRSKASLPQSTQSLAVADEKSIAVLPLVNLSSDSSDAYLASGITDELTSALSKIAKFRVASLTASKAAQDRGATPEQIGRDLNVRYLLEGTVQRHGKRLRVTTRLVDVKDGFTAWSDVYDRQVADLFAVQDYIARSVADALSTEIGGGSQTTAAAEAPALTDPGTKNPEAYDHYLRGRALFQRRDGASLQSALKEFRSAAEIDSGFARAHAGVASVYAVMPLYSKADVRTTAEQGLAAANKALRIDSTLAEGLAARGVLRTMTWKFDEASKDLQQAVKLEPNNPLANQWLGELKLMKGDGAGAVEALTRATVLDPGSPIIGSVEAMAKQVAGSTDSALATAKRAVEFDRTLVAPRLIYGTLLLDAGQAPQAVRELEAARALSPDATVTLGALGAAYAKAGDRSRAEELLAQLEKMPDATRAPSAIAKVKLALGDKEGALTWLKRAADVHDPAFTSEPFAFHFWDAVRTDPRFVELTRQVGLGPNVVIIHGPTKK